MSSPVEETEAQKDEQLISGRRHTSPADGSAGTKHPTVHGTAPSKGDPAPPHSSAKVEKPAAESTRHQEARLLASCFAPSCCVTEAKRPQSSGVWIPGSLVALV